MSTTPPAEPDAAPDPDSFRGRFHPAEVRNYLFAGLAALALVFVVLFARGSDLGGLLLVLLGAAGMALRWPGTPPLFLLVLLYFLVFPYGLPPADANPSAIARGSFGVGDMILAAAVLVYVACHYRVYALTTRAVPADTLHPPRGEEKPPRRAAANVRPEEVTRIVAVAVAAAIAGQFVWWGLTAATVDVLGDLPVRFDRPQPRRDGAAGAGYAGYATRLLLLVGLAAGGTVLGRLVFGYWRLRRLSPAEGGMIVQEAGWDETRREDARIAGWRAWGRRKSQKEE